MSFILFIFSFLGLFLAIVVVLRLRQSDLGIFHPASIFSSLAALDTFVPGIIWAFSGVPEPPVWRPAIDEGSLVIGLLYYIDFYVIMLLPLVYFRVPSSNLGGAINVYRQRLLWLLIFTALFSLSSLWYEISRHGGLAEWFWGKARTRWQGSVADTPEQKILHFIISVVPWRTIFNSLVLCAFYLRYEHNRKSLYGFIFPALAVLLALTTFFRGSILLLITGFSFVEFVRHQRAARNFSRHASAEGRSINKEIKQKSGQIIVAAITLFLVVGLARGYLESLAWDDKRESTPRLLGILSQGSGLEGVSYIINAYGEHIPYLRGKTYIDMLLLPVPRSIYTSKPEWYGIDDITRGMGWPESSQSAVTIPGEAFANFGWFGLMMAPLFGLLFVGCARVCINRKRGLMLFLYPSVFLYIFFVGNWMSFTGIMNQMVTFLGAYAVLWLVSDVRVRR